MNRARYIQEVLGIGKTRFFALVKDYRTNANDFSIHYTRTTHTRTIPQEVERNILRELHIEKHLIEDKGVALRQYNYSYIRDLLETN